MKQAIILACFMFSLILPAQHNNNWALGLRKGITFNINPPKLIYTNITYDSSLYNKNTPARISSSYSDCKGNLIVYGSGAQLWNKEHKFLKNGSFSPTSYNFTSPIIPLPGSGRYLYYFYYRGGDGSGCGNTRFL